MKAIKVYLQLPWKIQDSPYYKYLIDSPPKGIEYLNIKKQKGVIINKKKFLFLNLVKNITRKIMEKLKLSIPNIHYTKSKQKYDLIHCAHCLSLNKKPWIGDFEHAGQFWIAGIGKKTFIRKILQRGNCKKIIPWTKITKNHILKIFPEIKDKIEVIYPAIPSQKFKKKKNKKITLIYISRYFYKKGGLIALETLKRIKERYGPDIVFISNTPKELKSKYKNIGIKFLNLMPKKKLFKYMEKADIFFYPSLVDTFGFSLLEAMSFGLPIISVNTKRTKSREEIIENGKTGFLVNFPGELNFYSIGKKEKILIKQLIEKISILIENKKLRKEMSKAARKEIAQGKFSIKKRNKKLKRIYAEALRK